MQRFVSIGKAVFALTLLLCVGACATSGARFADMNQGLPAPSAGNGRIFIYRTTLWGLAVQPSVTLDGEEIGDAVPRGFFYVDRPAGTYRISTSSEPEGTLSLPLEAGQTRYVRLGISIGFFSVGQVYPELVASEEGESDIAGCRYIGK
jgi:hypothetical protein